MSNQGWKKRQDSQVTKWIDEIRGFAGVTWTIQAGDGDEWRGLGRVLV